MGTFAGSKYSPREALCSVSVWNCSASLRVLKRTRRRGPNTPKGPVVEHPKTAAILAGAAGYMEFSNTCHFSILQVDTTSVMSLPTSTLRARRCNALVTAFGAAFERALVRRQLFGSGRICQALCSVFGRAARRFLP